MGEAGYQHSRFYVAMGVVAILVAAGGFGESFYGVIRGTRTLTPLVSLHGVVFFAWLVLFVVQASLVATRRIKLHRQLGMAGVVLAIAIVVIGYQTAIAAARRGHDLVLIPEEGDLDPLRFLVFTLGDLFSFTILVTAAIWYRWRPEIHKRLMLLVTVGPMMAAALVHIWLHFPIRDARLPLFLLSMASLLFAGAVYDRLMRGRFHPVSLWGAVALFIWGNLRAVVIGPSEAWHEFAAWLIR